MKIYCGNCFQLGKYKEAHFLAVGSAYCDEHYIEAIKFAQEHQKKQEEE